MELSRRQVEFLRRRVGTSVGELTVNRNDGHLYVTSDVMTMSMDGS